MPETIFSIALTVAAFGLLILVHECGHFLAARAVGVGVEVFSIGFWKKIVSFTKGGTEYRLSLIPFGGYVKLVGEHPDERTGRPDELWSKTPGQRAIVFSAGVALNVLLAVGAFVVAFAIGVPFAVAEVGSLDRGEQAWLAGLRQGDQIVAMNGLADPDLDDMTRRIALGGDEVVNLKVERGQQVLDFALTPHYKKELGYRWLGFYPPALPIVNGLVYVGEGGDARSPSEEADMRIGDRILALNGRPVETVVDLLDILEEYPDDEVKVRILRDGETLELTARTEPSPDFAVGISCVSSTIEALQKGGVAEQFGFMVGDVITAVNGQQTSSIVEVEDVIRESYGEVEFSVLRDGQARALTCAVPDVAALRGFLFSLECESDTVLRWVRSDGPAWQAGMRPGDRVVSVAGDSVQTWEHILAAGLQKGNEPRTMEWLRDGELFAGELTPVLDPRYAVGSLGVLFNEMKTVTKRYGIAGAVRQGIYKTYGTVLDVLLTLRGVARGRVSARKNLGGVVAIANILYWAARKGPARLLYWMGVISACVAFMNLLPIPVLDGGHLAFLAVEKVRGRPVSTKVMAISQYVGMVLLLTLVLYVTWNDIARLISARLAYR